MVSVYPPASLGAVFNPRDYVGDGHAAGSIVDIQQDDRLDNLEALEAGSSLTIPGDVSYTRSTLPNVILKGGNVATTITMYLPSFGSDESRTFRIYTRGGGGVLLSKNAAVWTGGATGFASSFLGGSATTMLLEPATIKVFECTRCGGTYNGWFVTDMQDWTGGGGMGNTVCSGLTVRAMKRSVYYPALPTAGYIQFTWDNLPTYFVINQAQGAYWCQLPDPGSARAYDGWAIYFCNVYGHGWNISVTHGSDANKKMYYDGAPRTYFAYVDAYKSKMLVCMDNYWHVVEP